MDKIKKRTTKYILIFTGLILTTFTVFVIIASFSMTSELTEGDQNIIILTDEEYYDFFTTGSIEFQDFTRTLTLNEYLGYLSNGTRVSIIVLLVLLGMLISLLTASLIIIINRIQKKTTLELALKLNNLEEETESDFDENELKDAYKKVKTKFDNHLLEYKRINSYISHEQKNALTILKAEAETQGNQKVIEMVDIIINSVDELLTLSQNPSKEESYLVADVTIICAELYDIYKMKYPKLKYNFIDEDTEVYGKKQWIYQAISNLMSNAIKYGKNDEVIITVKTVKESVIIIVEDKGIGIEKSMKNKIFNHQFRIDELKKDGFGIGLSLVNHVCDLCNGYIYVESEINKGSKFYLSFPKVSSM